jgi:hypothetical protein
MKIYVILFLSFLLLICFSPSFSSTPQIFSYKNRFNQHQHHHRETKNDNDTLNVQGKEEMSEIDVDEIQPTNIFLCTQTQLKYAVYEKDHFDSFDLILMQGTINDLIKQQMRSFQVFKSFQFPANWTSMSACPTYSILLILFYELPILNLDSESIELFVDNLKTYSNAVKERQEVLICEILSNLFMIQSKSK